VEPGEQEFHQHFHQLELHLNPVKQELQLLAAMVDKDIEVYLCKFIIHIGQELAAPAVAAEQPAPPAEHIRYHYRPNKIPTQTPHMAPVLEAPLDFIS
jgi:hypothetical protein